MDLVRAYKQRKIGGRLPVGSGTRPKGRSTRDTRVGPTESETRSSGGGLPTGSRSKRSRNLIPSAQRREVHLRGGSTRTLAAVG
jgi:hypothetical protein